MSSLEELIEKTTEVIGGQIRKPKMSEKFLSRPPVRFLHDTVMALNANTQFVDSLLTEEEKDSSQVKDRDSKLAFLEKLIKFAGICQGSPIDVRASKIVAGAEPENTNMLLIALGTANLDDSIDFVAASRMALNDEAPGAIPRKGSASSNKHQDTSEAKSADDDEVARKNKDDEKEKRRMEKEAKRRQQEKEQQQMKAGKEKEDEDESKGGESHFDLSQVDGEIETTIRLYEGLIRKPRLTEKLLSKPPFRFLHDVMSSVNAACGMFDGLFHGEELDSKECTSREAKVGYLHKLKAFTEHCSGKPVEARVSRIAAGQEPENTNKLLQTIALLARNDGNGVISARKAVSKVVGDSGEDQDEQQQEQAPEPKRKAAKQDEEQKTKDTVPLKGGEEAEENDEEVERNTADAENKRDDEEDEAGDESEGKRDEYKGSEDRKQMARPQTARKRPPKIKEKATAVSAKENQQAREPNQQVVGVLMDGQDDSEDESEPEVGDDGPIPVRESDSTLDNNALKGKLVRDILQDEQKSEQKEDVDPAADEGKESEPTSTGITMGKIGQGLRRGNKSSGMGAIDVDKVRSAVQTLCQSTNPLGKCMDYIHEDLSVMSKELERWRGDYRKSCDALEDEKRITGETLHPLKGKLVEVDERIKDELVKLSNLKASIAKNDQRIAELLRDMVLH